MVRAGSASRAKAGVGLRRFPGPGLIEASEARRREPVARRLPLGPRRLQPVAQRHQFINLGDDAALLGQGWKGGISTRYDLLGGQVLNRRTETVCPLKVVTYELKRQFHELREYKDAATHGHPLIRMTRSD